MMKKVNLILAIVASVATSAGIVEETKSKPVLAAVAEVAPFGDLTRKIASLGTMINNPIVPTLLLTSGQQYLVKTYGRLRADSPIAWFGYVQTPAWDIASTNSDQVAVDDMLESVIVYPAAEGPSRLVLNHPGATKDADGTIHILPGENRPNDSYVRFTKDNRYCAFASSPVLAEQAIADFSKRRANRKMAADMPLVSFELLERGITAMASYNESMVLIAQQAAANVSGNSPQLQEINAAHQRRARERLLSVAGVSASLDLNDTGLFLDAKMLPKAGAKVPPLSDFKLPAGAFDNVPASSPLFLLSGSRLMVQHDDEASFRAEMTEIARKLPELLSKNASKKYLPLMKEIEAILGEILNTAPFPAKSDWCGIWFAFDKACHPYCEQVETAEKAAEKMAMSTRALTRLAAAIDKQWPGKGMFSFDGRGVTVMDWHAIADVIVEETAEKKDDDVVKSVADLKDSISKVMGSGKTSFSSVCDGRTIRTLCAAPGFKPAPDAKPTGEARVAAVLPEVASERPAAVFCLNTYEFVRNDLLPILMRTADAGEAKQYKAMMSSMPPAEPNGALVFGIWTTADGGARSVLRITSGELKNLGVAFNAFTAASLAGDGDDD